MKPRHTNAQLAVDMFDALRVKHAWTADEAWKGIATLLLTCQIFPAKSLGWTSFHDVVVFRESNDFGVPGSATNAVRDRAEELSVFLASELGIPRSRLCSTIGKYWKEPSIAGLQPNNLVGNAFRSLVAHFLTVYGDSNLQYEEEVSPTSEYPGYSFSSRSEKSKLDIVARRKNKAVALISVRWRFRHDRVDVVDEAVSYMHAARKHNQHCKFFAIVGEFAPPRLAKILSNSPPEMPKGAIDACVHFNPELLWKGLKENGRTKNLQSLAWLADQSRTWK